MSPEIPTPARRPLSRNHDPAVAEKIVLAESICLCSGDLLPYRAGTFSAELNRGEEIDMGETHSNVGRRS
jgi:hypothetical protein